MTSTPNEPVADEDIETVPGQASTPNSDADHDADGTDGSSDGDSTDTTDGDSSDGNSTDGDSTDA